MGEALLMVAIDCEMRGGTYRTPDVDGGVAAVLFRPPEDVGRGTL